jgi:hypothetical protein
VIVRGVNSASPLGGGGCNGSSPDVKGRGHVISRVQNAFRMGRFVFENLPIKINSNLNGGEKNLDI